MKKVWIAGAGYLGLALANQLQARYSVTASSRHLQDAAWWQAWDLNASDGWQDFQDADVWFVLLPPSSSSDYASKMAALCQQAQSHGIQQVVYASSTSVYGNEARVCDEDSLVAPCTASALAIVNTEQIWLRSGLPCVSVLRLGGLYDDERHPVRRLSGRTQLAGGKHPVNVVHKHHVLSALEYGLNHALAPIVNVVESTPRSREAFYSHEALRLDLPAPQFDGNDASTGKIVRSRYSYWNF